MKHRFVSELNVRFVKRLGFREENTERWIRERENYRSKTRGINAQREA